MASEWQTLSLAEVYDFASGLSKPRSEFGSGYPFLSFKDVFYNSAVPRQLTELVQSTEQERARCSVMRGDVFLTRTSETMDELGMSSVALSNIPGATFNGFTKRLRPKRELIAPGFARYFFRSSGFRAAVNSMSTMSTRASLNNEMLERLTISFPEYAEQEAIAHILGTLDDKIELNRKQNETLEAMARALFKAWFVDFEPVRAKIEGRWQRGQSLPSLPAHLYDLFPDRLVDSELGEIPQGWEVVRASQIYDVGIGKTPPRKESEWFSEDQEDVPWMSIKDLGRAGLFIAEVSEYLTPAAVERFRVRRIPDETVVLSFKLTVGRVAITDGEMLSNEAIAHFLPKAGNHLSSAYLYCYLRQFDYESLGSTSSIATAVNSDGVRSIPLLVPDERIGEAFENLASNSFVQIRSIQRESRSLAQLRDTLLPKLISGELRVPSIKEAAWS